ncbi:MAG TPA: NFACT RNA binding domain-containing protein [Verrucomicrobiae bacterium]|nr:NFACT RNA binding domain-containing protein [Verrucomicrobiae bacterium]
MVTDWLLVRRAAFELERRLRGAKVRDAGLLADGRLALLLRSRGHDAVLAVDLFGSPPLVAVEAGEPGIAPEPGFVRALAGALRGMSLAAVRARRGDRLLRLEFAARSRFGVGDQLELYLELVPRYGNAVLVKHGTIVAAAKEFTLAQNGTRTIAAGSAYELPPERPGSLLPKAVAEAGADEAAFLAFAQSDEAMHAPLHVYRGAGRIAAAHLVALPQYEGLEHALEASVLELFAELRRERLGRNAGERSQRRRAAAVRALGERERKLRAELAALAGKRAEIAERESLREQGEGIYATLHELPAQEHDAAKERALKSFARYKKLGTMLGHVEERERRLRAALDAVEALRWEAERAADEDIEDVAAAIGELDPRRARGRPAARKRKRAPLECRTPSGSRIVVGRSPSENADLTFRVARPNDLWFHAKDIPGAHVLLARDDRTPPPQADVERAASLAAYYSRAKNSAKVAVDYTLRKFVRKQQNAPPGLVWYTHPKTILVAPSEVPPC